MLVCQQDYNCYKTWLEDGSGISHNILLHALFLKKQSMHLNDKKAGAFKWLIPANETTRRNSLALADECALLSAIIVFFF